MFALFTCLRLASWWSSHTAFAHLLPSFHRPSVILSRRLVHFHFSFGICSIIFRSLVISIKSPFVNRSVALDYSQLKTVHYPLCNFEVSLLLLFLRFSFHTLALAKCTDRIFSFSRTLVDFYYFIHFSISFFNMHFSICRSV